MSISAESSCTSDEDCSLNGVCRSGGCECIAAWKGPNCASLSLLPASKQSGYHPVDDGKNTSAWGGGVLKGDDGKFHMFPSEMINHCGVNSWTYNSRIVHAVSDTSLGKFERREEIFPVFSHEGNLARDPKTGDYVMYFTAHMPSGRPECSCTDGSTTDPTCGDTYAEGATYMSTASSPNGPWSDPVLVVSVGERMSDTNLAPVILEDGSLIGMWRIWRDPPNNGSECRLVTASNWKDVSTYEFHEQPLFPEIQPDLPGMMGTEDPFLYRDIEGNFHAVFHNMSPCPDYPCPEVAGGHAFSRDGKTNWTYTGIAFNSTIRWDDGSVYSFLRRERPHLIFAEDGTTIIGLSTAVAYGGEAGDATYTFVQPVAVSQH